MKRFNGARAHISRAFISTLSQRDIDKPARGTFAAIRPGARRNGLRLHMTAGQLKHQPLRLDIEKHRARAAVKPDIHLESMSVWHTAAAGKHPRCPVGEPDRGRVMKIDRRSCVEG